MRPYEERRSIRANRTRDVSPTDGQEGGIERDLRCSRNDPATTESCMALSAVLASSGKTTFRRPVHEGARPRYQLNHRSPAADGGGDERAQCDVT